METVLVKGWAKEGHENGAIINKSDFDPAVHELFHQPLVPPKVEVDFLDRSVAKILEVLEAVTDEELANYLEAEKSGAKPRAGLIESFEKEIAARVAAKAEKTE